MDNNSLVRDVGNLPSFFGGMNPKTQTKFIPSVIGITSVAVGGWAFFKFAVPAIMAIISPVIAGLISFFCIMFSIALVKPVWKWTKAIANKLYRAAIKFDPDSEIQRRLEKFDEMANIYRAALAKMETARNKFLTFASEAEDKAQKLTEKLENTKAKMDKLLQEQKDADENVKKLEPVKNNSKQHREAYLKALDKQADIKVKLNNLASSSKSDKRLLDMNMKWTESHAAKSNVFTAWLSFLKIGTGLIVDKKAEVKAWWEEIKVQMDAAKAGKDATEALRFVLLGEDGQSYDFEDAAQYILGEIDENYSITAQNMQELMSRVDGFDFSSEEAYKELDKLLTGLKTGEIEMPYAREIASPAHELTSKEKMSAGALGHMF